MSLGKFSQIEKIYLSLDKNTGKIKLKKDNEIELFDYIEGFLTRITPIDTEYEGEKQERIHFCFSDKEGKKLFILQTSRYSLVSREIINALCSLNEIEFIRITPYQSEYEGRTFTHASVRNNNIKVPKFYSSANKNLDKIPKPKEIKTGKKIVFDTTDRDAFYDKLIEKIQEKIKYPNGVGLFMSELPTEEPEIINTEPDIDNGNNDLDNDLPFLIKEL